MTVSSCEYAGAQQQRSLSGASADAHSLCRTPGAITTHVALDAGEPHAAAALREEVDLLRDAVVVLVGRASGGDGGLGETLVDGVAAGGAGDLADLRAVEGDERLDAVEARYLHAPPAIAGRITIVSLSDTLVPSPSRTRTSSSLR
jgi:hypothetical protein